MWYRLAFVFFLLMITFFVACEQDFSYEYDQSYLKILRAEMTNLPIGEIEFRVFYMGKNPLFWNQVYLSSMNLNEKHQNLKVDSIKQKVIEKIAVFLLSDAMKSYTLLYDPQRAKDYHLYLNYPDELKSVDASELAKVWAATGGAPIKPTDEDMTVIEESWQSSINFYKNLYNFISNIPEDQSHNLFVVFISRNSSVDEDYIGKFLEELKNHDNWWFGLFYEGSFQNFVTVPDLFKHDRCLFCKPIRQYIVTDQARQIAASIELVKQSEFLLSFSFDGVTDPARPDYALRLSSEVNGYELADDCYLKVDLDALKDYHVTLLEQSLQLDLSEREYKSALSTLQEEYKIWKYKELEQTAHHIIKDWFTLIDTTKDLTEEIFASGDTLISISETDWHTRSLAWYRSLKLNFLLMYAHFQETMNHAKQQRVRTYERILEVNPGHKETSFKANNCKGDLALQGKRIGDALEYYHRAWQIKKNPQVGAKISNNLGKLLDQCFHDKGFDQFCIYANQYQDHIADSFQLRYYWAVAAKATHRTDAALQQYKWLMDHWDLNTEGLITWDELLNSFFYMYAENFDFNDSYNTLKKIFISELEEPPDLNWAIIGLRGQYMTPILETSIQFFDSKSDMKISSLSHEFSKTPFPDYIQAIYTLGPNNRVDKMIFGKAKEVVLPAEEFSWREPVLQRPLFISDTNNNWYILPITSGAYVMQTANETTNEEDLLLSYVKENITDLLAWHKLESYLHDSEKREVFKLIAVMIGVDYAQNGKSSLSAYEKAVKSFPSYKYFVVQDKSGAIVYNTGFESKLAEYPTGGWDSSSRAFLYYEQKIDYGNESITDIAYPIYSNGQWFGVIRMGVGMI